MIITALGGMPTAKIEDALQIRVLVAVIWRFGWAKNGDAIDSDSRWPTHRHCRDGIGTGWFLGDIPSVILRLQPVGVGLHIFKIGNAVALDRDGIAIAAKGEDGCGISAVFGVGAYFLKPIIGAIAGEATIDNRQFAGRRG